MLQQDLQSDQDQDEAAGPLRAGLPPGAEGPADPNARAGEQEGGKADGPRRRQDLHLQDGGE